MKINKNKKGFTLTELIIVIVIIGILAAVLIPSLSSYIKKAKTSKDIQNAKNMNNILIDYFDAQIPDNLEAADIRYVVQKNTSKYDFIPSAAKDGYSYWYNKETKRVVFGKAKDLEVSNGKNTSGQKNVANTTKKTSIEEIVDGYLLLDVSGTALSETLHSLRSISGKGEFTEIYNLFNNADSELMTSLKGFTDAQKAAMAEHINQFNPNQTLYINDFSSFTTSSGIVKYVVFDNNILNIPSGASQSITKIDGVLRIPDSVEFIEPGAFITIKEVEAIEINDARKIRISKTDTEDGNASFSAELIEKLGDKANQFLEMRSIAIAEAETKLAYEKEKITKDGLTYLPYNLSINPNVKIFNETMLEELGSYSSEQIKKITDLAKSDGYELGSSVFITKWRVKYDKNTNGTTTMNVKMFDDKGLIAAKTVVYREIYDINMSLDGANLTYDNVARLMYRDESDANDAAKNYTYTIKIGDMKFAEIKATEIGGTKGMKVLGDVENELTDLKQAQSRIQELYEKVKKASYVYTSEPTINKLENGLWTLSYTYTVNSKNDAVGKLQSATKTDTSNGNENTIADVYSIVEDVNATSGSDKYRIVKVSTQKGLIYSSKNVYYYLHNDKSNLDNYDGLLNSYVGKNLFVTNVYEKITASSLDSYKNQIDNDGNLNITITLQDNTNTEIISKTQKFKLNDISRVFSEEITDGQTQILDYLFNNIPAYFNQNSNVIDLYPEIFKRNFMYDYENQNIMYDLNDKNSQGYINLVKKLKGLYSEKTDEEIKKILEKAYFIKNTAPISKLGNSSTTYDPSKSDPYFLVIDLDTTTIGHKTMKLIGIFDELKIMDDGTSSVSSTSRIIQFNYRVGNSDELEITRINGRYLYGTGKNQEDPFYIYPFELNSSEKNINLGIRGLTQVKLIDNSTLNLDYSTIQSVKSDVTLDSKNNYQTVFEDIPGTDKLYKLTIKYYVGAINYYNEQTIYCKLIDKQQVEISTINNRDASLNDNFLFYQGENIGLTSNPFSLSIGNNIAQTNILSLTYTYSTGTIYQTILTVTKENNKEDKYYFIRGDKLPDELDLQTLSKFGLKITGDRSKCEINKDLSSDYYYCKGYYFSFENQKGETKIYYPYATNSPDLTNKYEAYKNVCPNPLQYFIIIKRADGTYGFDMIDTYLKVGKNTSGLAAYTAEVKNDINYWIDMNLKAGDKGTLKFDTYVYNYFAVKPSDVDNNIWKYKYNGSQFDNWILIDHYYSEKKYEVLSDELLNSNIQNLVINSQTYTWYGGDTTTIGKILFDADEIIQKRNRTYIQIPLPSKTGVQTIYASNNKNNYYIEMFLNGKPKPIDYNDPTVFANEKSGELTVKVIWYGLEKSYKFSYEVVDYMELAVDRVLNEKYYGQVVEVQNDKKLITNSYDGNTIFNLYDKFMPLASIRDIRISDDGVKVSIVGQGVNTTLVNDSTDSKQYKTLKELGCKDDEEYEITVLYANKEAKFKIKVVAKEKFEKAKFYYVNGRYISTNYGTSINPFYFVTGEKIKLPYGYEKGAFTNVYQNGYLDGSVGWLSATIYSPSSKTIDLCGILGNYDEKTKEFENVKFSVIRNNTKTPITFEQNSYAQIRYEDNKLYDKIIHTYYYTVSENVLSESGVLAVEFKYEGRNYKAELQFEVVDYYFTSINNRDQTYVAPNTTSSNIKTANQKVVFDHDENISLGSHLLSNGHIGESNRWYVIFPYQMQNSNYSFVFGGYTSDDQFNGKNYSGSKQFNGSTIYYDKTTSNLLSTYAGLYSYDFNQKASPFSAAYIRLYDGQNNLLTSQEGELLWKCDVENSRSLEINNFKFSEYTTATYGEIIFIERDENTQFKIEFIMRDDINKNDSENAHFVRVNNLYLNNYGSYGANYIPEFDISEGNPIYLNGATQIRLPDFRGKGVSNQYAPDIVYYPGADSSYSYDGKFRNSSWYSGYIVQYYLSQVSANELINSDYEYTVKDVSDTNKDRGELKLHTPDKWKMVERVVDSNSLDIWKAWPKDKNKEYIDEVILYLIYRYNDGKLYNLKLKLKVEKDTNTTVGVRRLNGVYYYPELGAEETEFIIDANNTVISLSNSSLYYSYSPIYTNSITFSKNAKYQYKLDGSAEPKNLTVKDNMIKLPSDEFIEGATGTIIISNMAITGIVLNPIEFKFRVAKYEGEIYKLNNMTSANGNFKVYKNEKISTSSAFAFKNAENEIKKTRGFNAFTQDVTINPYFLYYFETSITDTAVITKTIDEKIISYDEEGNEITTIVQTTTKYYVYGNYECEIIQEGDKYFYQIPDTETWKFEKNGILRVSYKPNPSAPIAYIGYANITIVEKTANGNLSYLYYDLINGEGKSVTGLQPLYTANVNAEKGHTKEAPIIILKNLFINSDYTNKIVVPKTTNSAFRYYRADGTLETVYCNNQNVSARVYDVNANGEFVNGREYVLGESSLYNSEEFNNETLVEGYGIVYSTNVKALVLYYELYGVTYSVTTYYCFSTK